MSKAVWTMLVLVMASFTGCLDNPSDSDDSNPSPVLGCTDSTAENYNANATEDDGSCTFAPPVLGCTDSTAENYNANATEDDGSCTFPIAKEVEDNASMAVTRLYDSVIHEDEDAFCSYMVWANGTRRTATEIDYCIEDFIIDKIETPYGERWMLEYNIRGAEHESFIENVSYSPELVQIVNVKVSELMCFRDSTDDSWECEGWIEGEIYVGNMSDGTWLILDSYPPPIPGCTDPTAVNYDPNATVDDDMCTFVPGCMNPFAENYDPNATEDDGSCIFAPVVKIGFLNPITGPLEPDAPGFSWGANEAIADLEELYPDINFELVEVDSACDGAVSGPGAQTLVEAGVVAVAGAACSGASMGANAVLSAAGIPMISWASTNPALSDASAYPLFYRIVPSDAIQGPAGAAMMADAGVTSGDLAILHMTNYYGSDVADSIKDAWEEDGNTLCSAGMQGYDETTTDFSSLAQSIVDNTDCTAVYLSSYITDAALIIEALNDADYTGDIYASDGPAGIGLYEKLNDNSMAEDLTVTTPRTGSTYGDFEARYDANAAEIGSIKTYVLTAYDAVMIIGKAAAMSGAINDNIKTTGTNYEGASGLLTFLDNGDVGGAGYDICTYDGAGGYDCNKYWTATGGVQSA